ncbi:MAG: prepilin-type N-terminal cleavage/methylation domain-containing protein [Gammaproteobacteria bacterium]|nr:MAG: prepilin-type N-terminal cleavage/methylation domain-containing protein [Gammaproteobacteria bacterium]
MKNTKGFTLIEMLVVVAIVAILGSMALAGYSKYVQSARRADAMDILHEVMSKQLQYYTASSPNTYVTTLSTLGYSSDTVTSRDENYNVTAQVCDGDIRKCVILTATPVGSQADDDCGSFTYSSRQEEGVSGSLSVEQCWR